MTLQKKGWWQRELGSSLLEPLLSPGATGFGNKQAGKQAGARKGACRAQGIE